MDSSFLEAFRTVMRKQLIKKNVIHIEGVGQFKGEHQKQHQKQFDNGRVVLMPPRDTVRFVPEAEASK